MLRFAAAPLLVIALVVGLAGCAPATDPLAPEPFVFAAEGDDVVEAVLEAVDDADPVPPFVAVYERNIFGTAVRSGDYQASNRWAVVVEDVRGSTTTIFASATSLGATLNVVGVPTGPAEPVIHTVSVTVTAESSVRTVVTIEGSEGPPGTPGAASMVVHLAESLTAAFPLVDTE